MNQNKIFLSSNIKYLRTIKGKTQDDIAKICNKKNTAISNWEKGIREPDAIDLATISNYFGISVDVLMKKDLRLDENLNLSGNYENYTLDNIFMKKGFSKEEMDIIEKNFLKEILVKKGVLNENDEMTEENFNRLIQFAKNNKDFIINKKDE